MSSFCLAIKLDPHYAILALKGTILLEGLVILSREEKTQTGVGALLCLHLITT